MDTSLDGGIDLLGRRHYSNDIGKKIVLDFYTECYIIHTMKLKDIKILSLTRKDYTNGNIIGLPICNYPLWQKTYRSALKRIKDLKRFKKFHKIFKDNRTDFKRIFGKPSFTFNGSHYFHGWLVEFNDTQLIVLTAKEHGTEYELVIKKNGIKKRPSIKKTIEFLELLMNNIKD
jgi:hypothetical protein